jgi:DNA-binding LytR/AlgR family response regulator
MINFEWEKSSIEPPNFSPGSGDFDSNYAHPISLEMKADRVRFLSRITVKLRDKLVPVHLQDVLWIQSKGNLLCIHLQDAHYDCRMTMKEMSVNLDPACFLRVHRNAIVNLDHVVEFDLPRYGNAFVLLRNGKALPISRTGRAVLRRSLLPRTNVHVEDSPYSERRVVNL